MIGVLCARRDSIYKALPGCDVFDVDRDARSFTGGMPVIAHPPCRAWGRLRKFAKPAPGEKELGLTCVDYVRECGGVLEHPAASSLFVEKKMPLPGQCSDVFGGYTIEVKQFWWGHRAEKRTWLYVVGVSPREIEPAPLVFGEPDFVVKHGRRSKELGKKVMGKAEREHTPVEFAHFLIRTVNKITQ